MSDAAIRRSLARASSGKTLDVQEATWLLQARGAQLDELLEIAGAIRDRAMAGSSRAVTFSPKVFLPVTHLCRDRCHYCTFVASPTQLAASGKEPFLSPDEVLAIAQEGAEAGCLEALFTLGDRPEERWPEARDWLHAAGYESTLHYVRALAILVLEETGLLPHLNPGVMRWEEMARLRPVAPSMGMMLETSSRRLFEQKGAPHFGSPDKDPAVRLRVLEDAGRLSIPFTTGMLVGIGENYEERAQTLVDLRTVARRYGHIQEVIVQNFRPKPATVMRHEQMPERTEYLASLATARILLGERVHIQAPPNLSDASDLAMLLCAGVDDWGGVSPVSPDHVNPERPWPSLESLRRSSEAAGFDLRPRLAVQPRLVLSDHPWIDPRVRPHVDALADLHSGLARSKAKAVGRPWQEPEARPASQGRVDLHRSVDTIGRSTDRRSDFDSVYGNWTAIRDEARASFDSADARKVRNDLTRALEWAADEPERLLDPRYSDVALQMMTAEGSALDELCAIADHLREVTVGDAVTYVVNRNINFTNVCYVGCRFCAFAQRKTDADAYTLSLADIQVKVAEAAACGATEICMQGGIDPSMPSSIYVDLARAVKEVAPSIHLHAFSPMEVVNGATRNGVSIETFLVALRDASVDSLPGTAAEILDDDVRWLLTKGKLPAQTWVEVVSTAHKMGVPTTSTMMYGHVDHPRHWVAHLRLIADIQTQTGGFTEFVPLPFVHTNAPLYLAGVARPGPSWRDNRAVHAMARILLHGRIPNIQASWVKLGDDKIRALLTGGVNDLGGTLMEETISRMAGSENGSFKSAEELQDLALGIGRRAQQRNTLYGLIGSAA